MVTNKNESKKATKSTKTKKEIQKDSKKLVSKETTKVNEEVKDDTTKVDISNINEKIDVTKKKETNVFKLIYNILFWTVLALLAFVWVFDYVKVKNNQHPIFCVSKSVKVYQDGAVNICNGLGYNVYEYNRASENIKTQFSPFFIGEKK